MYDETLKLVATLPDRKPAPVLPDRLAELFRALAAPAEDPVAVEDAIWQVWMYHPHRAAAIALDRAASDIAAQRYDIAETRLALLLRARPDFPEAWHKRATLYYLLERDADCVQDLHRTLELEPRHFPALCALGEIFAGSGHREAARLAFGAALRVNPHLERARDQIASLNSAAGGPH